MRYCKRCKRVALRTGEEFCSPCVVAMIRGNAGILTRCARASVPREPRVAGYPKNRTWKSMRIRRTNNYVAGIMFEARQLGMVPPSLRRY